MPGHGVYSAILNGCSHGIECRIESQHTQEPGKLVQLQAAAGGYHAIPTTSPVP